MARLLAGSSGLISDGLEEVHSAKILHETEGSVPLSILQMKTQPTGTWTAGPALTPDP